MEDKEKLLIIDSNALLHRAFHALPPLTTKNGEQTGAIYGFLLTLFKAIKDLNPNYIVACFDTGAPTFRHQKFEEYKAKRPKTPEDLKTQLPKTKEVLEAFGIPVFAKEGFEADDLIATISTRAEKENKHVETYILTGDLDTLQLVDENTKVYTLGRGIKDTVVYDEERVFSRFEISPRQMVDFKSLTGDPSDNIPGVMGVGKKTAADLLKKFKSLDNLYQKIQENKADIKPRIKELLSKNKEQAFFARTLVEVKKDVDIDFDIKKCRFGDFNQKKAEETLNRFEFHTLVNRLPALRPSLVKPTQKSLLN
jgi:DNA polymerase-1